MDYAIDSNKLACLEVRANMHSTSDPTLPCGYIANVVFRVISIIEYECCFFRGSWYL